MQYLIFEDQFETLFGEALVQARANAQQPARSRAPEEVLDAILSLRATLLRAAVPVLRHPNAAPLRLADLISHGMMNDDMAALVVKAVQGQANIAFAGAANTGKTTLLRAFVNAAVPTWERVVTIENLDELGLDTTFPNAVRLHDAQYDQQSIHDQFIKALRMMPDRLIVSEVQGILAKDVLEAAQSETGGLLFTMYLNRPDLLFHRFHSMLMNSGLALPYAVVESQVKNALDLIIQVQRPADGTGQIRPRRITEIAEVHAELGIVPLWQWEGDTWVQRNELSRSMARRLALHSEMLHTRAPNRR